MARTAPGTPSYKSYRTYKSYFSAYGIGFAQCAMRMVKALHMAHGGQPYFGMFDPQPCAPEFPKHIALSMPCATPPYPSVPIRTRP